MSNKQYNPKLNAEKLTRYIPFTKYVDFLCNGLFCPKVLLFEDAWEGHIFHSLTASSEHRIPLAAVVNNVKAWIYASCWHAANHESYAMWKIYGQLSEAVGIHTTFANLKALMASHCDRQGDPVALLSSVEYVNPTDGQMPELSPETIYSVSYENSKDEDRVLWRKVMQVWFAVKPLAYEYEQEVRLLILDKKAPKFFEQTKASDNNDRPGIYIHIDDYSEFLTGISIAPYAPKWFSTVLEKTNEKFGLDKGKVPLVRSSILDGPGGFR